MELYESLFIIRPTLSDEETTALIEKMKGTVTKNANFGVFVELEGPRIGAARNSPTRSSASARAPMSTSTSRGPERSSLSSNAPTGLKIRSLNF